MRKDTQADPSRSSAWLRYCKPLHRYFSSNFALIICNSKNLAISNRNFIPAQHTVMTCNCTYQGHPLQEAEKNDLWSFLARVQDRIRSFMGRQSVIWPKRRCPAKQGTLSGVLSRKKYRLFSFTTGGKTAFIGVTIVFIVAHK